MGFTMARSDRLVDDLRTAIIKGQFAEGQPLRQDEIASTFGTSKIPVREALRHLEGEGLVVSIPNRGVVVSRMSAAELNEICEVRCDLESRALSLAIPHLDGATLTHAQRILEETERDTEYLSTWSARNWSFHSTLYRPAQRPLLLKMIEDLNRKTERYLQMHVSIFHYRDRGQAEHRAILEACRRKDVDEAIALLRQHISDVSSLLEPILSQRAATAPRSATRSLL